MEYPISRSDTLRVCRALKINPKLYTSENRFATSSGFLETMETVPDPIDYLRLAYRTELEHGSTCSSTDVTHNRIVDTFKIVKAHLIGVEYGEPRQKWRPFPGYYDFIWAMEKYGHRKND